MASETPKCLSDIAERVGRVLIAPALPVVVEMLVVPEARVAGGESAEALMQGRDGREDHCAWASCVRAGTVTLRAGGTGGVLPL